MLRGSLKQQARTLKLAWHHMAAAARLYPGKPLFHRSLAALFWLDFLS